MFYSISNAQRGLRGISFGNFLIKRVVDYLSRQFKNIKSFVTLSPIPGFNNWFKNVLEDDVFLSVLPKKALKELQEKISLKEAFEKFMQATLEEDSVNLLKPLLMSACSHYLVKVKHVKGSAIDSVANFHLTNGASIKRLNWMANKSEDGLRQSLGMMVNYHYNLADIDTNHENYINNGHIKYDKALAKGK